MYPPCTHCMWESAKQLKLFSIPLILALAEVQLWIYIYVFVMYIWICATFRIQNSKVSKMSISAFILSCCISDYCTCASVFHVRNSLETVSF